MSINWIVLIGVIVLQYVIGALWYSLVFGKQWMKINHPNGLPSKEEMIRLEKEAMPYYGIQLVLTTVTAWVHLYFVSLQPSNWFATSILIWIGFLVPSLIQAIIWSDPHNKQKPLQVGIMALHFLLISILAGWAFATFR
jgi:hypothetical protein